MNIDQTIVENLSKGLKEILDSELRAGNRICETYIGNWPNPNSRMVFLERPFLTPIRRDIPGIVYRAVDDHHYWRSEYYDEEASMALCCEFDEDDLFSRN